MTRNTDVLTTHRLGGTGSATGKSRLKLADLIKENSTSVYVKTHATKMMKVPTHVLLPHKSSQGGEVFSFEIPMTFIPIDLAAYAPKEELIRNTTLMNLIQSGVLELLSTDAAEEMLDQPDAQREIDRLQALRQSRLRPDSDTATINDDNFRSMHPETALPKTAPGELDAETASISVSVVDIFNNKEYSDDDRLVMLRNLLDILTDNDKRYIRSKTRDDRILQMIG